MLFGGFISGQGDRAGAGESTQDMGLEYVWFHCPVSPELQPGGRKGEETAPFSPELEGTARDGVASLLAQLRAIFFSPLGNLLFLNDNKYR